MYNSNRQKSSDDDTEGKLFVGGLAWDSTEETITEYFEKFGPVQEVALKRNKEDPSKHRGFCFVKFSSPEDADSVLSHKEPHFIDGSKVDPKSVCPAGVRPEQRTKKIFVGGLQDQTTEDTLMEYFNNFGEIQSNIEFSVDRSTQKRRGFCFIEFANEGVVDRIVRTKFHSVAGVRLETKRVLSKQQRAEESAQAAYNPAAHGRTVASMHAMAGAYNNAQQLTLPTATYGQPVIYIHPDSLSTAYPSSVLGYQALQAAGYSTAGYNTAIEMLQQPYNGSSQSMMANRGTQPQMNTRRQAPYTLKKY